METRILSPLVNIKGTPSTFIENWYGNKQFLEKEITREGSLITVLNSYVPSSLNAGEGASFYLNFKKLNSLAIGADIISQREIFPLYGGAQIKADFDKFYLTWYPNPVTITNNQFTTNLDEELSTPILLHIGKDLDIPKKDYLSEKSFRYGFTSVLPTTTGTSLIQVSHGYTPKNISVVVNVSTAANPLSFTIWQRTLRGANYVAEFVVNPSVFPFSQTYVLPDRDSPQTQFQWTGGGAGETGQVSIVIILTPY